VDNKPLKEKIFLLAEAIAELKALPRWETPEQYVKRTGERWPDDWAVYYIDPPRPYWDTQPTWEICRHDIAIRNGLICVVATEAGPPPDGWRPEDQKSTEGK
jgi:hypothetical protein